MAEKYLYFRSDATAANDDDAAAGSNVYPLSSFLGMESTANSTMTLYFKPKRNHLSGGEGANADYLTDNVIDAAVLWKPNSYIPGTFMSISFQFKKHLALGRGGIILTDNKKAAQELKKMSYDGRHPDIPWREQDIKSMGYHYYMTPETATLGLKKLPEAIKNKPIQWTINDWPDVSKMEIFKETKEIDPYLQTR